MRLLFDPPFLMRLLFKITYPALDAAAEPGKLLEAEKVILEWVIHGQQRR